MTFKRKERELPLLIEPDVLLRRTTTTPLIAGESQIINFGENRVCAKPSCDTKLSRYNSQSTCSAHGGWYDENARKITKGGLRN